MSDYLLLSILGALLVVISQQARRAPIWFPFLLIGMSLLWGGLTVWVLGMLGCCR